MSSVINRIKSLLLNRNTVVILSVFAGIIVLWYIYNKQLDKVIKPTRVPAAGTDLIETKQINSGDITYVEVNTGFVKKANILTSAGSIINKYVANGTSIKKGALFSKEQVVDKADLIVRDVEAVPTGYSVYNFNVNFDSTYANSIYPGDRIDLWIYMEDANKTKVFRPFITSIEVLVVKDSKGKNVFDGSGKRSPSKLTFIVDQSLKDLLIYIENNKGIKLIPVPRNKKYTDMQAEPKCVDLELRDLILAKIINPTVK